MALSPRSRVPFLDEIDRQLGVLEPVLGELQQPAKPSKNVTYFGGGDLEKLGVALEEEVIPEIPSNGRGLAAFSILSALSSPERQLPFLSNFLLREANTDGLGRARAEALERIGERLVAAPEGQRRAFQRRVRNLRKAFGERSLQKGSRLIRSRLGKLFDGAGSKLLEAQRPLPAAAVKAYGGRRRTVSIAQDEPLAVSVENFLSPEDLDEILVFREHLHEGRREPASYDGRRPIVVHGKAKRGAKGFRVSGPLKVRYQNSAELPDGMLERIIDIGIRAALKFVNRDMIPYWNMNEILDDVVTFGFAIQRDWFGPGEPPQEWLGFHNDGPDTELIGSLQLTEPYYHGGNYGVRALGETKRPYNILPQRRNQMVGFRNAGSQHSVQKIWPHGSRGVWRYTLLVAFMNDLEFEFR